MNGRGRRIDNLFVERLWRSLKHEAKAGISSWMTSFNVRRPHQALGSRAPMAVLLEGITGALGCDRIPVS
jgi:putative transposase